MSGSSASHVSLAGAAPGAGRSRRRRLLASAGLVLVLVVAALVAAALVPSSHASSGGQGRAVAAVAPRSAAGRDRVTAHAVFGSSISARAYGALASASDDGVTQQGQLVSDLTPLSPSQFQAPFAAYKRYAAGWAVHLAPAVAALTAALRSGDRGLAQARWDTAFFDYLHLGAVYGFLPGTLNNQLAEIPPSTGLSRFPGLHMIEKGLWTGAPVRSLVPVSLAVQRATARLIRVVPGLQETPLDYSLRAHEILEDAQRDLMSGLSVPWSGEGVLGTDAGVIATDAELSTLTPLLQGRDNTLGPAQYWLARLRAVLVSVRRPDGSWPTLDQLSQIQLERVDGTLQGTLSALQEIPGALETVVATIPSMPAATHSKGSR